MQCDLRNKSNHFGVRFFRHSVEKRCGFSLSKSFKWGTALLRRFSIFKTGLIPRRCTLCGKGGKMEKGENWKTRISDLRQSLWP
jgi:hypothetical protein